MRGLRRKKYGATLSYRSMRLSYRTIVAAIKGDSFGPTFLFDEVPQRLTTNATHRSHTFCALLYYIYYTIFTILCAYNASYDRGFQRTVLNIWHFFFPVFRDSLTPNIAGMFWVFLHLFFLRFTYYDRL